METVIYQKTRSMDVKNTSHKYVEMSEMSKDETRVEFNTYCDSLVLKIVLEANFNPVVVSWDTLFLLKSLLKNLKL